MNWEIAGLILPLVLAGIVLTYLRYELVCSSTWYDNKWKNSSAKDWLMFVVAILLVIFIIFWIWFAF